MTNYLSNEFCSVLDLISRGDLFPHFQPIVNTFSRKLVGYEALIRTSPDCPLKNPSMLFEQAASQDCVIELELECLSLALQRWISSEDRGWLFVNLGAEAFFQAITKGGLGNLIIGAGSTGSALSNIVVELTEHQRILDLQAVQEAAAILRANGGSLALDDFGDGHSSLRLWSELTPEFVKIDKYFTRDIHKNSNKVKFLKAIQQLSEEFHSNIVSEGVEHPEELLVLRDLGIQYVQGYFLGHPSDELIKDIPTTAMKILQLPQIAVLPEKQQVTNRAVTAASMMIEAPCLPATASHDLVASFFSRHEQLHTVALCEDDIPIGLIGRSHLQGLYLGLYFRDLHGRRPCIANANLTPLIVDIHTPIEELTEVLTSEDQRYLTEGYILTENGKYRGLGSGEQLVRRVTEARIEAARHANPLTFLPGNVPINIHIERLLDSSQAFLACYADLNNFKAFNDYYGYWRGDQMIKLQAECFKAACDPRRDFIGHIGGDDFILLMQSADGVSRITTAAKKFNNRAKLLFDAKAQKAGAIQTEGRDGKAHSYPLTTVSIGIVHVEPCKFLNAKDVANEAAIAKRHAKNQNNKIYYMVNGKST